MSRVAAPAGAVARWHIFHNLSSAPSPGSFACKLGAALRPSLIPDPLWTTSLASHPTRPATYQYVVAEKAALPLFDPGRSAIGPDAGQWLKRKSRWPLS